jgi:hypothetical protein
MAKSLAASAGYLGRATGSVVNSDYTLIVSFMWPNSPSANQYRGVLDIRGRLSATTLSAFQVYQVGDSEPSPGYAVFLKDPDNVTDITRVMGTNAELNGKWIHLALVYSGNASSGSAKVYALTEGFDRSSPSYLFDPDIGPIRPAVDTGNLFIYWNGEDDVSEGAHLGHYILVPRALSESECLDQFLQRDPISSIAGDNYAYLPFWLASAVGKDRGPTATDFTSFSISASNSESQPSEWKGLTSLYWIREASSGTTPAVSADEIYPPLNLNISFSGVGSWGENYAGRGFLTGGDPNMYARDRASGTKYEQFNHAQQITLTVAADFSPSIGFIGYGLEIIGLYDVWFIYTPGDGTMRSIVGGDEAVADFSGVSLGYHILTIVLDLGAASSVDRFKFYVDGVLRTTTTGHSAPYIDYQNGPVDFTIGHGFPNGVYACFVYSYAIDSAQVAADAAALLSNNDFPPSPPLPPSPTEVFFPFTLPGAILQSTNF